jgi:bacillaene synthase trans-acting acyltransferase
MNKKIVFMFSGQGSQYYSMGKQLYENHPRFKLWMDHCDELIRPYLGVSLVDIIYDKKNTKSQPFDDITLTNPALLSIEYSLAKILIEQKITPDYLLGYSLGEVTANVVSGALAIEDALKLSIEFAKCLQSDTQPAGMLAILDSSVLMSKVPSLFENIWLTGQNFSQHFVVSGLVDDIKNLQKNLSERDVISQRLPVNFGFHTPLMDPVEDKLKSLIATINVYQPRITTISSRLGRDIRELDEHYFWAVIREPVVFETTINNMLAKNEDYIFIDVGPSGTLATFVKYLLPNDGKSVYLELINQYGKDMGTLDKFTETIRRLTS